MSDTVVTVTEQEIVTIEVVEQGPSGAAGSGVLSGTIDDRPNDPGDNVLYIATDTDEVFAFNTATT